MIARLGSWLAGSRAELRLVFRITLAGLISFGLGHLVGLAQSYWAVLTSVLVVQASVGGSLKTGFDRMLGTLGGAVWGAIVALAIPHDEIASLALAVAVAIAPLALLVAFRPAFRVAPVTAIIVLLGGVGQAAGPLEAAASRTLEISLGTLVALAVALFVLPARAHTALAGATARTLSLMAELLPRLAACLAAPQPRSEIAAHFDRLRTALEQCERVAEQVRHERASYLAAGPEPEPAVRNLRRLRNDLSMIWRAVQSPLPEALQQPLAAPALTTANAVAANLRFYAGTLAGKTLAPAATTLAEAMMGFDAAMTSLHSAGLTRELDFDEAGRVFALAFTFDQLRRDLEDLAARVAELAPARAE